MGRRRIQMFQFQAVVARLRAGDSDRQIDQQGLLGRQKVAKVRAVALTQGWLAAHTALPDEAQIAGSLRVHKRSASTVSRAQPWRDLVAQWVQQDIQGTTIYAALCRDHGFTGSYSSVIRLVRQVKCQAPVQATTRLSFAPAQAAQVDFGAGPILRHPAGDLRRTWAFVMTLCFSRHQYVEFVWDQTVLTWQGCHRRAFEWFAGVPETVIIDNAKCAITRACYSDPQVQRSYGDTALGYGFKIDACPPREPQLKGIVESGVKYVKNNFLPLRQFVSLADLNEQAKQWVLQTAGVRKHGTTRQAPLALFELELPLLADLPTVAPDGGQWRQCKVHRDCHIQVDRAYYSVPFALVGQPVWVRMTDSSVAIYHEYEHAYTHARALRPGQRMTCADHMPPNAQAFAQQDARWCLAQANSVGPHCGQFIQTLLGDQILVRLRAAQNVLRLKTKYGNARLEAACHRALLHQSMHYQTVKSILHGNFDQLPLIQAHEQPYAVGARYTRDAHSLFNTH
jgi:transposase